MEKKIPFSKIGSISQLAGIRHYQFADGKAKGVEAAEVHTGGGLTFTVLPGRGMDIAWTEYKGTPVNYMSKSGVVAPAYYHADGMDWLFGFFAGTVTTCGLLNVGGPEKITHPVIGNRTLGLHGRITHNAAEQVSLFEDFVDGEYVMKVSGLVREGILHGESLTMRREITTKYGAKSFTVRDTVTNHSQYNQDIMLLYHINIGYPVLDAGSRLIADSVSYHGLSDEANADPESPFVFGEPVLAKTERCYSHTFRPAEDGLVHLALVNDRQHLGVALTFDPKELPAFNEWKMMNEQEYVVGLEPGTALPCGYQKAKESGGIDTLAPHESKTYGFTYTVLDGDEEIRSFEKQYKH